MKWPYGKLKFNQLLIAAVIIFSGVVLSIALLYSGFAVSDSNKNTPAAYPEMKHLSGKKLSFQELSNYFTDIAKNKGAKYAFNVLRVAPISPDIDMHLLAHVVGDILYRQEGLNGIKICTNDFRNACSHSIVVGLFFEKGEAALTEISEACRNAPGGSGAYTMCFHGLGHGILAYAGYDLTKTVELCEKTGTPKYHEREYVECVGGAIMEMVGGGFHNMELWLRQQAVYFKDEDPLYPCTADFMPEKARSQCLVYLTPHLFQIAGGDLGRPGEIDFKKAFAFCERLQKGDIENRNNCYGGFGKEFIVFALSRDIRLDAIAEAGGEEYMKIYNWCMLADNDDGKSSCIVHAVNSLYWGGENDRGIAVKFCGIIPGEDFENRRSCFLNLMDSVGFYIKDNFYRKGFCKELPKEYLETCLKKLL